MINEILVESEYADIIITLLQKPYNVNSIAKLVFMSFCIHNERNIAAYRNRKKDFIDIFMQNIYVSLDTKTNELLAIFEVIDKLKTSGWINVNKDKISIEREMYNTSLNRFLLYCSDKTPNPILEINKLDANAFMEEVLRYV